MLTTTESHGGFVANATTVPSLSPTTAVKLAPPIATGKMRSLLPRLQTLCWAAALPAGLPHATCRTAAFRPRRCATVSARQPHATLRDGMSELARARNSDPGAVAVVVGASRGIGLAVVQALVTRWKGRIIATCRDRAAAGALGALWQFMPDRFSVLEMDITDEQSVRQMASEVRKLGDPPRVDFVFHSAGILHEGENMPETSLSKVDATFFRRNLDVNLIGPVLVAKHLSPMMITHRKPGRVASVFACVSAKVGSIEDNRIGGWLSYRSSKAGQNQAIRTMSIELGRRGVICASLHPGTVATDLSQPFRKRVPASQLQDVDVAAGRLLDVVDRLREEDNGGFYAYDGERLPF